MIKILVLTQGPYGERIARNLRANAPSDWKVEEFALPNRLPGLIDEPEEYLPATVPEADILLSAGESPGAAQLIPAFAKRSGARSVIAPIDNSGWLPPGLANQIKTDLSEMGITTVFPKPFCSLTENSYGFRRSSQPYKDDFISKFARHFGRPKLKIKINPQTKLIQSVEVERNSACGSVAHAAKGLVGISADEADIKAGLILHHYPCLCSMNQEWLDDRLYDTLMHASGYIMNEEVAEQVKPFKTPPQYISPSERVEEQ
jgi:thymidylate synthase